VDIGSMVGKVIQGDCLSVMKEIPDESIDMCITSPPYWALRDYGIDGQLGLELTFIEYITKLCGIFDEVKRVLKKTGSCWVNLGDAYSSHGGGPEKVGGIEGKRARENKDNRLYPNTNKLGLLKGRFDKNKYGGKSGIHCGRGRGAEVPEKCLCLIPQRFCIEMVNRGWLLRNTIIWHKRNCMPSSVTDRFTVDFEYLFFFVKSKKYYFEQQFEDIKQQSIERLKRNHFTNYDPNYSNHQPRKLHKGEKLTNEEAENITGRNKRCVWTINTQPFKEAHYATFPEELCITPIKSGCPEFICDKCGEAREPIYKSQFKQHSIGATSGQYWKARNFKGDNTVINSSIKTGYTDCGCNAGFHSGIVLDIFAGACTSCLVANKLGRDFIGIELNPSYVEMGKKRLEREGNILLKPIDKIH